MTIKGTLETFNLRELLQMLAFNQKVGTLVLETERGTRCIYVQKGQVAFVAGDEDADKSLLRVVERTGIVPEDRLGRALQIRDTSGRWIGDILHELGACDLEALSDAWARAAHERFLTLQLTSVSQFEFVDGKVVAPDGSESKPLEPWLVVDSLLLDLTRKMDQWVELSRVVPGLGEIYEGTGLSADLGPAFEEAELDESTAARVLADFDGARNLHAIVDHSKMDELTVMEVTAACVRNGILRAVPTSDLVARGSDLLSRGEAQAALPVFRRVVEREDAPPEARLRLADALVATDDADQAAAELDTYASLSEDARPQTVFDALQRALALRDGDVATATRLCDFYLRNRPWLDDRREAAMDTLRALIHGAVSARRPLDAARRLQLFISNGDAPSEDLLVLADLYSSGGEPREGAAALYCRAEELIRSGRNAAGRDMLRRVLELDPTRADARSQLHVMQGASRRKRRRVRTFVFIILLGMLLVGAGGVWWSINERANDAIRAVRSDAAQSVEAAEAEAYRLLSQFEERLEVAAEGEHLDSELAADAGTMLDRVRAALTEADEPLFAFADAVDRYPALASSETNAVMLRTLESRRKTALHRAQESLEEANRRSRRALEEGEIAHREGRFTEALALLRVARNLALLDSARAARASRLVGHVEKYVDEFEAQAARMEAARARDDLAATYSIGVDILATLLDSDLTRSLRLPVTVTSQPAGAEVRLGGVTLDTVTPCVLEYSPFEATDLEIRLPGRIPKRLGLPDDARILAEHEHLRSWAPIVEVDLPEGPGWVVRASEGPFRHVWATAGVPVLLTRDGDALLPVERTTGRVGDRRPIQGTSGARLAGTFGVDVEWRILGRRTFVVRADGSDPWEMSVLGDLHRPPALANDVLVVVDERGTAYGFEVTTGKQVWMKPLGSAPTQAPLASRLGILLGTVEGGVVAIDPTTGTITKLPVDARGASLALPLGDGAVVLGGGVDDIHFVGPDRTVTTRGTAAPIPNAPAYASSAGVAWIEATGVRWLAVDASQPLDMPGLGRRIVSVTGSNGVLYAARRGGVLAAARLDAPTEALWSTKVGATISGTPVLVPDYALILVDGGLAAVAR